MRLDLSGAQAFGVQVHDPGIQTTQSGLAFLDQLRVEGAFTVSRRPCPPGACSGSRRTLISSLRPKPVRCCCRGQESEFALHGFAADTVAFVATLVADLLAWPVAEMRGHFGFECPLEDRFAAQARKVLV